MKWRWGKIYLACIADTSLQLVYMELNMIVRIFNLVHDLKLKYLTQVVAVARPCDSITEWCD